MVVDEASNSSSWNWEQEKTFENALAIHSEDLSNRWEKIAEEVPGKTIEEIKQHYELLIEDIDDIESGRVPLPKYASSSEGMGDEGSSGIKKGGSHSSHSHGDSGHGGKGSISEQERRKGVAWTEDEHRLFLLGLDKYGKGDWRSISRNFVISRTPTQVASHAQKYFIRLNSMNKDRRRASIHDITSVGNNSNNNNNNNGETSAPQGPITDQTNGSPMVMPGGKPAKSSPHQPPPGVGVFGTAIGQPAIGTPVILPVPSGPHMAYGVRAPVAGSVVPGAPMNLPSMTYLMPHTSAHR